MQRGLELKLPWSGLKIALLMALFLSVASGIQAPCGEGEQTCDQNWNLMAEDVSASTWTLASSRDLAAELSAPDTETIAYNFQNTSAASQVQNVATAMDTARSIKLTATDINNDLLSYSIVSMPNHGKIRGSMPNIIYVPDINYTGNDSFVFSAYDSIGTRQDVTVNIDVMRLYHPPTVRIREPQDGEIFAAYEGSTFVNVPIYATVSGEGMIPGVNQVEFFDRLDLLGSKTCPAGEVNCPVTLIAPLYVGTHTLIAQANDSQGKTCTSLPVVVVVNPAEPTAKITSPLDGEIFTAPENITITAIATYNTTVSSIDHVEFFANTQKLGSATSEPYAFVWQGATPGVYNLVAKVFDTNGSSALSKPVMIVVVPVKPLAKSDLVLTMTFSPDPVPAGGWLNFLLTVTNRGPDSATDVTVENFLPPELTPVIAKPSQGTYDENTGVWIVGGVTKYRSAKLVLNVQVPNVAAPGHIANTAYVYGNEYDPDNSNNHVTAYIQVSDDNATLTL